MTIASTVGKRMPRLDALGKVTGKAVYAADFTLPGMLYGKVLRSTHPHAVLRRADPSEALKLPGVRAIVTARDIPLIRFGSYVRDESIFAIDQVRHVGQPIAAVAADTLEIAEQALDLIRVEYDDLPALYSAEEALKPNAILVHPDWASYDTVTPTMGREGNLASRTLVNKGDVDLAFREADFVFEDRFDTQIQHQGYMEPRAAVADIDASGHLTVWTNTQLPFATQMALSEALNVSPSKLRVVVTAIGGGFGGKLRLGMEPYAVILAQKTGQPVKVMTTVEEELTSAYPRHPTTLILKTGVLHDGTIIAKEGRIILDTGAFAGAGPIIASVGTMMLIGPYKIPNLRIEGLVVYSNKTNFGSFRAPSAPQAVFACESQMDMIAERLGLDPLKFRFKNLVAEGDVGPTGTVLRGVGIREALEKVATAIAWDAPAGKNEGKGIACSWWTTAGGSSGVYVKLNSDGTVVMCSGAPEIGTAALMAGAAQLLADALTIPLDDIEIVSGDTVSTPYDFGAAGSRTALSVGSAARIAAKDIKRQLFELASKELAVPAQSLILADRAVVVKDNPQMRLTLAQCAQISNQRGGGIIAHGTFIAPTTPYDPSTVVNHFYPTFNSPGFNAHAAQVKLDPDTGEVTVMRYVVAQDVGFAINPTFIEGQIEGGVAQGLGHALFEEIVMHEGHVQNPNLTDYKMPTIMDVPRVESIILQYPTGTGPHGAKGVGEPPVIEPPAVIANAIARAVGARVQSLPITAEKVLRALKAVSPRISKT